MKTWHWGIIVALVIGYAVGVYWPGPGASLKVKLGV